MDLFFRKQDSGVFFTEDSWGYCDSLFWGYLMTREKREEGAMRHFSPFPVIMVFVATAVKNKVLYVNASLKETWYYRSTNIINTHGWTDYLKKSCTTSTLIGTHQWISLAHLNYSHGSHEEANYIIIIAHTSANLHGQQGIYYKCIKIPLSKWYKTMKKGLFWLTGKIVGPWSLLAERAYYLAPQHLLLLRLASCECDGFSLSRSMHFQMVFLKRTHSHTHTS